MIPWFVSRLFLLNKNNFKIHKNDLLWCIKYGQLLSYVPSYLEILEQNDRQYAKSENPIIVYQMGKVGSSTVQKSLAGVIKAPVFHAHYLFEEDYIDVFNKHYTKIPLSLSQKHRLIARKMARARYLEKLIYTSDDKKWKIITLVRDPIGRNISDIFQLIYGERADILTNEDNQKLEEKLVQLLEIFQKRQTYYYEYLSMWFDRELKKVFGVDVFLSEFPKEKGYHIYTGEKADVLLIRLESLNTCYNKAFHEFLGLENISLFKTNRSQDKGYDILYKLFQKSVNFPPGFLEKMYSLKYVRHFYTEREINNFTAKWSRHKNKEENISNMNIFK